MEKFIGDAVVAVFGAPTSHEDDPERAVRAALAIQDAIAELNEAQPALELEVRIGVNTGEALVALEARPEAGEGMVSGDVINTAARLQSAAPPGACSSASRPTARRCAGSTTRITSRSPPRGRPIPSPPGWQSGVDRASGWRTSRSGGHHSSAVSAR